MIIFPTIAIASTSAPNMLCVASLPRYFCLVCSIVGLYAAAPIFPLMPHPLIYMDIVFGSVRIPFSISWFWFAASFLVLAILICICGHHHGGLMYGSICSSFVEFCHMFLRY